MPDRRTFLITCTGAVAAPALSIPLFGASSTANGLATTVTNTPETPVLRIDGWESPVDSGSSIWIQVNTSWRAAWR
jgi:hypothetical protein